MNKSILHFGSVALALLFVLGCFLLPVPALADPKAVLPPFILGDTDVSGKVSAADARLALRLVVKLEEADPCSRTAAAADVDYSTVISASDARLILRAAVGLEQLPEGIRESCDLFTVTLPEYWAGQYIAEASGPSISFFYKSAREKGLNGLMFSLSAYTMEEIKTGGELGVLAAVLDGEQPERYLMIGYPGDMQTDPNDDIPYFQMTGAANGVAGSVEPASAYVYPYFPDYGALAGKYYGSDSIDMYYSMDISTVERNAASGTMKYASPNGEVNKTLGLELYMIGGEGYVWWTDGDSASNFGTVSQENGNLLIDLNGVPGSWPYSSGVITFYPDSE